MKSSDFIFDGVTVLHYKYHKINLKRGDSDIDSPDWIKNKKITINSINETGKQFQYTTIVALNHELTEKNSQRISKIKL